MLMSINFTDEPIYSRRRIIKITFKSHCRSSHAQSCSGVCVKDEPLWVSANAELKLDQQIVKVNLTLLLSDEPFLATGHRRWMELQYKMLSQISGSTSHTKG